MRYPFAVLLLSSGAVLAPATAQSKLTEHTRKLDAGTTAKATLADVAWLEGRWLGEGLGGTLEETWSPALGGAMVATFRLVKDGQPSFYEMCWIREKDGGLEYAVKHFHADLKGWEEKDAHVAFPLVAVEGDTVHFQGLTLVRDGDRCTHYLAMRQKDGTHREMALAYRRADPTPVANVARDGSLAALRPLPLRRAAEPSPPETISFEQDALGAVPKGFTVAETNGKGAPATWRVTEGLDAHDKGHVVMVETANTGSTFNLLLSDTVHPADLTVAVHIYPRRGEEDQGGGLVWRARDAANYYVARWNPLEDNVRLYTVVDGKRALLESADVMARPGNWHQLTATMLGDAITLQFDGKPCLVWRDATFRAAGRIGLWTKADATTLFDRIEVSGR